MQNNDRENDRKNTQVHKCIKKESTRDARGEATEEQLRLLRHCEMKGFASAKLSVLYGFCSDVPRIGSFVLHEITMSILPQYQRDFSTMCIKNQKMLSGSGF